jgi:ribonucleotide reductase beta subunit family protein with ferritin-like domain
MTRNLGVWVAVSRWRIVGPLFFEETVKSKRYCSMLHDFFSVLEEDEITYSWFQQLGATAYTANNFMKLLNEIFREHVISRNLWSPCLSDLTPPYFYLWGAGNSAVCHDCPRMLNELKTAITAYIRNISQAYLRNVFANKIKWVQACIDTHGHYFQHLL